MTQILKFCECCGQELYKNDEVIHDTFTDEFFCDLHCYIEHLGKHGNIQKIEL